MKTRPWLIIGLLLVGGYVSFKVAHAVRLTLGLSPVPLAVQALVTPKRVMEAYPFDEGLANAAEGQAEPPATAPARMARALGRAKAVQRQALHDSKGDPGKAMDLLLTKSHDPDAAQALFEAMREVAPQGSSRGSVAAKVTSPSEGTPTAKAPMIKAAPAPLYAVKAGEAGIVHVARVAGVLGERLKGPNVNPMDVVLLEESIRLMGIHGAPQKTQTQAMVVGGPQAQTASAIDPLVKGTLRIFFKSGEPYLAAQAARALGRLGDAETAEDLIKNPQDYPGASIADFGPDQVEKWKQNRLKLLSQGKGVDEASYWQSVRLTPRHMDTAIDLAQAGDAGAGMAVERNMSIEATQSNDPDGRMAQYIDTCLRFPGTREAWKARAAMGGYAVTDLLEQKSSHKTREACLRALDHDLKIIFGQTTTWRPENLIEATNFSYLVALNHHRTEAPAQWNSDKFGPFYDQMEALFRKHYRKTIVFQLDVHGVGRMSRMAEALSRFARHLGLPAIDYPGRMREVRTRLDSQKRGERDSSGMEGQLWAIPRPYSECIAMGHIKSLEDF